MKKAVCRKGYVMTKEDAIKKWVKQEFSSISQDWAERLFISFNGYAPKLPMWGTMWVVNQFDGEKFMANSRRMVSDTSDIDLEEVEENQGLEKRKQVEKDLEDGQLSDLYDEYVDEEMAGELNVLDKDGSPTAVYIYELDDEYIIGVNGAGWDFYDGVWNKLYDVADLHWHSEGK